MSSLKPSTARTIEEAETAAKASGTQRFDLPSGNRLFVQWQPTHSAHAYHLEIMRTGDGYSCGRDGAQKALETMPA